MTKRNRNKCLTFLNNEFDVLARRLHNNLASFSDNSCLYQRLHPRTCSTKPKSQCTNTQVRGEVDLSIYEFTAHQPKLQPTTRAVCPEEGVKEHVFGPPATQCLLQPKAHPNPTTDSTDGMQNSAARHKHIYKTSNPH